MSTKSTDTDAIPEKYADSACASNAERRMAYLTGTYPRATDTFIQREVATLRTLGYHVQTFSIRKPPDEENVGLETVTERAATIYLLPPKALFTSHLVQMLSSPKRYFAAVMLAVRQCPPGFQAIVRQMAYFVEAGMLARQMKTHTLSHLHNHFADSSCSVAAIAAQMGGFTFSLTMHGPAEFLEPRFWWIGEKIRRALFVNCISHFCRSQAMLSAAVECWDKLRIVHCGVDPSLFDLKKHTGFGNKLLFVGRLAAAKGLPILLRAIARLDGATLDIAGDGPDREMLREQTRSLGISDRVKFLGYRSQLQVRELLRRTDIFVLSSFAEGVPVVLMEAMAAGIPVVATQISGIPELVRHEECGLLVSPGDEEATASSIRRLMTDCELRNKFAAAGREMIEREFNINTETKWLATILTNSLAGNPVALRPQADSKTF